METRELTPDDKMVFMHPKQYGKLWMDHKDELDETLKGHLRSWKGRTVILDGRFPTEGVYALQRVEGT